MLRSLPAPASTASPTPMTAHAGCPLLLVGGRLPCTRFLGRLVFGSLAWGWRRVCLFVLLCAIRLMRMQIWPFAIRSGIGRSSMAKSLPRIRAFALKRAVPGLLAPKAPGRLSTVASHVPFG